MGRSKVDPYDISDLAPVGKLIVTVLTTVVGRLVRQGVTWSGSSRDNSWVFRVRFTKRYIKVTRTSRLQTSKEVAACQEEVSLC